jgi:molybdopterin synthase catalytic subunit
VKPLLDLREVALSTDEVLKAVAHPGAGATVLFVGTVRDNHRGRPVTRLEYEAYRPMAISEMESIEREIAQRILGVRLACVHRVGSLELGESAVICAASAPHRDEAFRACRLFIDLVKERVPIWKREHGPSGASWVGWEEEPETGNAD